MSAWIESHQSLRFHPKTTRLARRLGVSGPAATGHLHYLWWWAMDYAQDGDLADFDAEEIAIGAGWDGDPDAFIDAAITAGFLDVKNGSSTLVIHDWYEYAGKLLERREKDRQRKAAARREPVQRTSDGSPADGVRTEPTEPTEPNQPKPAREAEAVDNSGKPRRKKKEPVPAYDLVPLMGPITRLVGRPRIPEALDDSSDLNQTIRRFLAAVDDYAMADVQKPEEAKARCRYQALDRLKGESITNPAAYLTAAAGNATCLGDLVGDDFVTELRQKKRSRRERD